MRFDSTKVRNSNTYEVDIDSDDIAKWFKHASPNEIQNAFDKIGKVLFPAMSIISRDISRMICPESKKFWEVLVNKMKSSPSEPKHILDDEEIEIFNAYIDDCLDDIAFGDSDWTKVYDKITDGRWSEKATERAEKFRSLLDSHS